jgi:hypothetical protein
MKRKPAAKAAVCMLRSASGNRSSRFTTSQGQPALRAAAASDPILATTLQPSANSSRPANTDSGRPKARARTFGEALRQELALYADDDPKSLRGLARRLISEAAEAENPLAAIKEIANRLDADDGDDAGQLIHHIERSIVHPEDPNGKRV